MKNDRRATRRKTSTIIRPAHDHCPSIEMLEDRSVPAVAGAFAGSLSLNFGSDSRVTALAANETEAHVAVNPINPGSLFAMSNNQNSTGQLIANSTDAGVNWNQAFYAGEGLGAANSRFDGASAIDDFGNIHIVYMWRNMSNTNRAIVYAISSNGGATFTSTTLALAPNVDKPWVAVGPDAQNLANQVVVVTFNNVTAGNQHMFAAAASISGVGAMSAFSSVVRISDAPNCNYGIPAVGPNGEIAVTWQNPSGGENEVSIFVDRDLDGLVGGLSFGTDVFVATSNAGGFDFIPATPERSAYAAPFLAYDRSGGAFHGRLYLVYAQEPVDESNDWVIHARHSNDNGATFSGPWLVSGTTIRSRFLQSASVDQDTGFLWVSYYDCRNDYTGTPVSGFTDNIYNNETQYFVTVSVDGGMNFLPDVAISDGVSSEDRADAFWPGAGAFDPNDYGDYTGIAAIGGSAYAVWADNSNGVSNDFDVAMDRVWISSSGGQNIFASGSAGDDVYFIRRDASGVFLQIYENNPGLTGRPTFTATYAAVNKLFFDAGSGNDTVIFDFSNGNPIPAGGYEFNGGGGADTLKMIGDVDFLLTPDGVTAAGTAAGTLISIEALELTGGVGVNMLTVVGTASADAFVVTGNSVSRPGQSVVFSGIETLIVDGGAGGDMFQTTPAVDVTIHIVGNSPNDSFAEADFLVLNHAGATSPVMTATGNRQGFWSYGNRMPVHFSTIEKMTPGVTISGRAYLDVDRNRVDSGGEPGLGGVNVQLYGDAGTFFGQTVATSAGTGAYSFTDLAPGYFRVRQNLTAGYMQSSENPPLFNHEAPVSITGVDFGSIEVTIQWTGLGGDSSWGNSGNWLPVAVPGPNDVVGIPASAGETLTNNIPAVKSLISYSPIVWNSYTALTEGSSLIDADATLWGSITGAGDLKITGALHWFSGTIDRTGLTEVLGGSNWVTGTYGYTLSTGELRLHGLSKYSAGFMTISNNARLVIEADGVLEVDKPDVSYSIFAGAGADNRIVNYGVYRNKNPNSGLWVYVPFHNYGEVFAAGGFIGFGDGGIQGGVFAGNPGTEIRLGGSFGSPIMRLVAGSSHYGDFTLVVSGTTLTVDADSAVRGVRLGYYGIINGTAALTAVDKFTLDGGTIQGQVQVFANGGLDVLQTSIIRNPAFHVLGSGTWTGGHVTLGNGAQFVLESGSQLVCSSTANSHVQLDNANGSERFINRGTLSKTTAALVMVYSRFENSGVVDAQQGHFAFNLGGVNSGHFTGQAGASIRLTGGTTTFLPGAAVAPALGNLHINGGTLNLDDGVHLVANVVTMEGYGVGITGPGNLTVTGKFNLFGGSMTGTGQTIAAGGADFSVYHNTLNGRKLTLQGTSRWLSAYLYIENGGQLVVDAGAELVLDLHWNWQGWSINGNVTPGVPNILNYGTIRVDTLNGYSGANCYIPVINHGVVDIAASNATFYLLSGLSMIGGELRGVGRLWGNVVAASGSSVAPGASPGQLTIQGNLNLDASSTMAVELDGLNPGSGYDQIKVIGSVNLGNSELTATRGFAPTIGTTFVLIDNDGADPVVGTFKDLPEGGSFTIGGQTFTISYFGGTGNDVVLTAGSAADTVAPTIIGVYFSGAFDSDGAGNLDTVWSAAFRNAAGHPIYGFPAQTGANQLKSLPWSNVDTIYIQFSEAVVVTASCLAVRGINNANYALINFNYDSVNFVASWVVVGTGPGGNLDTDRFILDLDGDGAAAVKDLAGNKLAGSWTEGVSTFPTSGAAGQDFLFRFVVAVGDVDRNGIVRNADLNAVRNNVFVDAGQAGYNIFHDVDGNGQIRNADVNAVRARLFQDPPSGSGPFRNVRFSEERAPHTRSGRLTPALASRRQSGSSGERFTAVDRYFADEVQWAY